MVDFIVTNNNNGLFSVQPAVSASGTLTYTGATGMDGVATVSVRIHDNGGTASGGVDTSAIQTFTITVLDTAPSSRIWTGGGVDNNWTRRQLGRHRACRRRRSVFPAGAVSAEQHQQLLCRHELQLDHHLRRRIHACRQPGRTRREHWYRAAWRRLTRSACRLRFSAMRTITVADAGSTMTLSGLISGAAWHHP